MKIAIVGLRFGQKHLVAKECKGLADFSFVDADRAETSLPEADVVILMTRFIRHFCTQAAYQVFPRERVHLHDGGISKLVRRIKRIAGEQSSVEKLQT